MYSLALKHICSNCAKVTFEISHKPLDGNAKTDDARCSYKLNGRTQREMFEIKVIVNSKLRTSSRECYPGSVKHETCVNKRKAKKKKYIQVR